MGNYLLTLHRPGHATVRYPVQITRQHHWDGVPPGDTDPAPVRIPRVEALADDEVYVPAGWCWVGSQTLSGALPWQRVWIDGFVIERYPVTLAQYQAYLNTLVASGDEAAVAAAAPRLSDSDAPFLHRDADGRFDGVTKLGQWREVLPDTDRLPMVQVDHDQCLAYAKWRGTRDGLPSSWSRSTAASQARRSSSSIASDTSRGAGPSRGDQSAEASVARSRRIARDSDVSRRVSVARTRVSAGSGNPRTFDGSGAQIGSRSLSTTAATISPANATERTNHHGDAATPANSPAPRIPPTSPSNAPGILRQARAFGTEVAVSPWSESAPAARPARVSGSATIGRTPSAASRRCERATAPPSP